MASLRHLLEGLTLRMFFVKFFIGLFCGKIVSDVAIRQWGRSLHGADGGFSEFPVKIQPRNDFHRGEDPGEDALRQWMNQHVRVLCWVMTCPPNLYTKASHVKATWAKRCNKILYVSSEVTDFPTLAATQHEGREYLWQKTRGAFQHIYDHHIDEADWFMKADDDTYVIVENLRKLLSQYDPNQPIYFGRKLKPGFMSGGAGYVLSRGAVKIMVQEGFRDDSLCRSSTYVGEFEDVEMWNCLRGLGIESGDSRDAGGLETFHPLEPERMVVPDILPRDFWYLEMNFYTPTKEGRECCSENSISFHYVPPYMMHLLEYLVYQLRPFGARHYPCPADLRSNASGVSNHSDSATPSMGEGVYHPDL